MNDADCRLFSPPLLTAFALFLSITWSFFIDHAVAASYNVNFSFKGNVSSQLDQLGVFGPANGYVQGPFIINISYQTSDFEYCPQEGAECTQTENAMRVTITFNGMKQIITNNSTTGAVIYIFSDADPEFDIVAGGITLSNGVGPLSSAGIEYNSIGPISLTNPGFPLIYYGISMYFADYKGNVENIFGTVVSPNLVITRPSASVVQTLNMNTGRQGIVDYTAEGQTEDTVDWGVMFSYTSSGGIGPFTSTDTFSSALNDDTTRSYIGVGGQATVIATSPINGTAPAHIYYMAGSSKSIPVNDVTSLLTSLYSTGTPQLLAHIAVQESSYCQFKTKTLTFDNHPIKAQWPIENYKSTNVKAGEHIGLMMVTNSMANAFDWNANAKAGLADFNAKKQVAIKYQNAKMKKIPNLPSFNLKQLENEVLANYGGYVAKYYIPGVVSGAPAWVLNPADSMSPDPNSKTPPATKYIMKIRNNVIPTQTSCQ